MDESSPRASINAADLVAELAKDEVYQADRRMRERELAERAAQLREAEEPILADLRAVGLQVASVWDLVNTSEPYPEALPVLMDHFERGCYPDRVLEGIGRALAVKPAVVYWSRLEQILVQGATPIQRDVAAVALSVCATKLHVDDLVRLINTPVIGENRILFLRPLKRLDKAKAMPVIESLRNDPELGREARAILKGLSPNQA